MLVRCAQNPIIAPIAHHPWESKKVYNPGVIHDNGEYSLFYRACGDDHISRIGYGYSFDGEEFVRYDRPLLEPEGKYEFMGIEDPRITKVGPTYMLTYTAFDGNTARLTLALSEDLKNWKRNGPILPDWSVEKAHGFRVSSDPARNRNSTGDGWSKSGAIFPEKINGYYHMLFGDSCVWLAVSKNGRKWEPLLEPLIGPRQNSFDSYFVEMGPPPIKTEKGWLVIYHGVDKNLTYRLGFLLLDLGNPCKIIYRSFNPIFEPALPYECKGLIDLMPGGISAIQALDQTLLNNLVGENKRFPKVIFACGAVLMDGNLRIYYGCADTVIGTASAPLSAFLPASD